MHRIDYTDPMKVIVAVRAVERDGPVNFAQHKSCKPREQKVKQGTQSSCIVSVISKHSLPLKSRYIILEAPGRL